MKQLDPEIVSALSKKTGKKESTIKKDIYLLASSFPSSTKNAVAQQYARRHGATVFKYLDDEDRLSMPPVSERAPSVSSLPVARQRARKEHILLFIRTTSKEFYKVDHVEEINRAYTYRCYTACFVLSRKVVENLVIDVLRTRFPPGPRGNLDLYFDASQSRYRDFGILLKNLSDHRKDFGPDSSLVERIVGLATPFKKEANDKTHSWYHIVKNREELDRMQIQDIIDLLEQLLKSVASG